MVTHAQTHMCDVRFFGTHDTPHKCDSNLIHSINANGEENSKHTNTLTTQFWLKTAPCVYVFERVDSNDFMVLVEKSLKFSISQNFERYYNLATHRFPAQNKLKNL